ncbi:SDR family oxidoreductase [Candidatus Pelagibacter sp. Uisw_116]|uniref:NAD-dependent epimerase/dehydratase family protein n=1 Tax=Candidatus Pelagibacter sp. Uisw_116 TaxID=3230986 RepID=UPI0039E7C053
MKIIVTGGCGYTGTVLTQELIKLGHRVIVIDTQWFGNHLKRSNRLNIIKKDIRNLDDKIFDKVDTVVHLANIANDPSAILNPSLSWEINVLGTKKIVEQAIKKKVKHFIFASSGSVYGVKKEKKVTEDLSCVPISVYNKTKMISEKVLLSYSDKIKIHCIRPATVCGFSPRMRLDVSVNMFTYQALKNKRITVFGGKQIRPNINIKDLVKVYIHFIKNPKIESGNYNAGFENLKILDIANLVKQEIPCKIDIIKKNNDPRSYRQDSGKLLKTGFKPSSNVKKAILDIKNKYENNEIILDEKCNTVKWMKKIGLSRG